MSLHFSDSDTDLLRRSDHEDDRASARISMHSEHENRLANKKYLDNLLRPSSDGRSTSSSSTDVEEEVGHATHIRNLLSSDDEDFVTKNMNAGKPGQMARFSVSMSDRESPRKGRQSPCDQKALKYYVKSGWGTTVTAATSLWDTVRNAGRQAFTKRENEEEENDERASAASGGGSFSSSGRKKPKTTCCSSFKGTVSSMFANFKAQVSEAFETGNINTVFIRNWHQNAAGTVLVITILILIVFFFLWLLTSIFLSGKKDSRLDLRDGSIVTGSGGVPAAVGPKIVKNEADNAVKVLGRTFLNLVNSNQDFRETIGVTLSELFADSTTSGNRVRSSHEHANSKYDCRLDYQWLNPNREVVACLLCVDRATMVNDPSKSGSGSMIFGSATALTSPTSGSFRNKQIRFQDALQQREKRSIGVIKAPTGSSTGSRRRIVKLAESDLVEDIAGGVGEDGVDMCPQIESIDKRGGAQALEMQMRVEDGAGVRQVWHTASGFVQKMSAEDEVSISWTPGAKLSFCEGM